MNFEGSYLNSHAGVNLTRDIPTPDTKSGDKISISLNKENNVLQNFV